MSIYIRPYIAEDVQYLAKWNLGPQEWKKWDAPYFAKLDDEEMAKNWGKGYATEAIALWTKMVFAQLPDIWRIDMATWSGNVGMMKVAEKVGYTLEGRFRKARIVDNKYYDSLRYGILREDLGL